MYRTHTGISSLSLSAPSECLTRANPSSLFSLSAVVDRSLVLFSPAPHPSTWHISNCNNSRQQEQQKQQLGRVTARRSSIPAAACCNSNTVYSIKNFADRVMSSRSTAATHTHAGPAKYRAQGVAVGVR